MPRIPLIEDLTRKPVPGGSRLLVEYDPASQWYNASLTIAAGWLQTGGRVAYNVASQPAGNVRIQLERLGLRAEELEEKAKLLIYDWYSATLGQRSVEKFNEDSLKVADMSIGWMKEAKELAQSAPSPGELTIVDDISSLDRFNEEKVWVEFILTRIIARNPVRRDPRISTIGLVRGLHSERVYKRLEAAFDGVIDFRLDDLGDEPKNLLRVRSIRNVGFDGRWHPLKTTDNFEVALEAVS